MAIYILLIAYILALSVLGVNLIPNRARRERMILRLGMLAIFLLLALKKDTVGIDILGYKAQYVISAAVPWSDTDYVYFEPGYIQLMKLFSKAGLDFQVFAASIYGVCCVAYYKFLDRYSQNVTLSLLIFICYQFLVFYTSGLRQALSMAICVFAFLLVEGSRNQPWLRLTKAVVLVLLAASIHKSALLFLVVILFTRWQPGKVHWVMLGVMFAASFVLRPAVHWFIRTFVDSFNGSSGITLAGNFVFLTGLTGLGLVGYYQRGGIKHNKRFLATTLNVLMMALIANVLFSGSTLLRSAMYFSLFLIPGLTHILKCYEQRIEILLTSLLGVFFIMLFWIDTLSVNQLQLLPYRFFWQ